MVESSAVEDMDEKGLRKKGYFWRDLYGQFGPKEHDPRPGMIH